MGAQSRQAFRNIAATLAEAGAKLKDVVKITTFIVPMERYAEFAAVRGEVFDGQYPASSTVGMCWRSRPGVSTSTRNSSGSDSEPSASRLRATTRMASASSTPEM